MVVTSILRKNAPLCSTWTSSCLVAQRIGRYTIVVHNGELSKLASGLEALAPLCDDHGGTLQVIHSWATDLVDHFDSGEVKWGSHEWGRDMGEW